MIWRSSATRRWRCLFMVREQGLEHIGLRFAAVIGPVPVPVGEHERRDVREAVRHGGPLYGVDGSIFEEHHWPTSVVGGKRLEMVQEQPLVLLLQRIHAHHRRGRHLREREPGADADHIELEVFPQVRYRREGHRRGARRGDRGRSRMGGSRRPCRKGGRVREHGRVGPVEPRVGRLQPLPAATRRECCARWTSRRRPWPSRCWKPSTSCAATPRRGRPASRGRIRSGAGCCAPNPITACGRRRCGSTCATRSAPATSGWRGRGATAAISGGGSVVCLDAALTLPSHQR